LTATRPLVVGLAGGIASGKSTCATLLAGDDGVVLDADAIARQVEGDPAVVTRIEAALGLPLRAPDGTLDRVATARAVFQDASKRRMLESIVHPLVRERIERSLEEHRRERKPAIVVLDIPLLYEGGFSGRCDRVVFVDSDPVARADRAELERGWGRDELARREAQQLDLEEKRKRADFVVTNKGSRQELGAEAARIRNALLESHVRSV
jgi:dephospho-CoA kinase